MALRFKEYRAELKAKQEQDRQAEIEARAEEKMSRGKQQALNTMRTIKRIFDEEGGELLSGTYYSDFMAMCDEYIEEIENTWR